MFVYLLFDTLSVRREVCGVFSTEENARQWLAEYAKANGWTRGEIETAKIEEWPVDVFC